MITEIIGFNSPKILKVDVNFFVHIQREKTLVFIDKLLVKSIGTQLIPCEFPKVECTWTKGTTK